MESSMASSKIFLVVISTFILKDCYVSSLNSVTVKAKPSCHGKASSIKVNGQEHSQQQYGLNVVTIDIKDGSVVSRSFSKPMKAGLFDWDFYERKERLTKFIEYMNKIRNGSIVVMVTQGLCRKKTFLDLKKVKAKTNLIIRNAKDRWKNSMAVIACQNYCPTTGVNGKIPLSLYGSLEYINVSFPLQVTDEADKVKNDENSLVIISSIIAACLLLIIMLIISCVLYRRRGNDRNKNDHVEENVEVVVEDEISLEKNEYQAIEQTKTQSTSSSQIYQPLCPNLPQESPQQIYQKMNSQTSTNSPKTYEPISHNTCEELPRQAYQKMNSQISNTSSKMYEPICCNLPGEPQQQVYQEFNSQISATSSRTYQEISPQNVENGQVSCVDIKRTVSQLTEVENQHYLRLLSADSRTSSNAQNVYTYIETNEICESKNDNLHGSSFQNFKKSLENLNRDSSEVKEENFSTYVAMTSDKEDKNNTKTIIYKLPSNAPKFEAPRSNSAIQRLNSFNNHCYEEVDNVYNIPEQY